MKSVLYIHGYGSNSQAAKALQLKAMIPEHSVIIPTFDFNHHTAQEIQQQIRNYIADNHIDMLVGSSLGGFHAICATLHFEGPVWAINPVTDPLPQFTASIIPRLQKQAPQLLPDAQRNLQSYKPLVDDVFKHLPQRPNQINLALSTDDETLGDHSRLPQLFPAAGTIVWKDNSGHHFTRFAELREAIRNTIESI